MTWVVADGLGLAEPPKPETLAIRPMQVAAAHRGHLCPYQRVDFVEQWINPAPVGGHSGSLALRQGINEAQRRG